MPIVEITIFEGRTDEAKLDAMQSITDAVVRSLAVPAGDVRVIIREIPRKHMTIGGALKPERRRAAAPAGNAT